MDLDLSVIIPVCDEEKNIALLHKKIVETLKKEKLSYEILFIDDGSTDNTFAEIKKLRNKDDNVRVIEFMRNFGKAAALNHGFMHAQGDIVVTMDGDLQDDPKEIPRMIKKINEGYDLVSGWKQKRKDLPTKKITSFFYNRLTSFICGVHLHDFNCGFKAYRRIVVKNIKVYGELHRYIPVLATWKGFRVTEIPVEHHSRKFGHSKYGAGRIIRGFFDLLTVKFLTKFTKRPLHFFGSIGLFCIIPGIIIGGYLSYLRFGLNEKIGDRPLLLLTILLIILGVQFISLGLLGELFTSSKDEHIVIRREIR